jgi:hypothetical protein
MSTSAAFAGASAANNAMAQAAAHQAKVERCIVETGAFNPSTASTIQKQSYAECITTLYPNNFTGGEVLVAKVLIAILLIAMVVGAIRGWREDGVGEACLMGFAYAALASVAIGVAFLVLAGVAYLIAA